MNTKNGYREMSGFWGSNLEDVVLELLKRNKKGEKWYINFNGNELYSDNITVDSAYIQVLGKTKAEHDNYMRKQREKSQREEKEYKDSIPSLIQPYKDKARGIILEKKLEYWDEIVPIRLNDLYRGMELDCTIEIAKILNKGGIYYFKEAEETLNNQNHSGMSYGLMKSMIREFCFNGESFVNYLD